MVTNAFNGAGPPEDEAAKTGVQTFIETGSGSFTPIEECTKGEIAAEIMALLAQAEAEATMDYPVHPEGAERQAEILSLLNKAKELTTYLNV